VETEIRENKMETENRENLAEKRERDALLRDLAERYETKDFINGDPSWFMHQVSGTLNQEITAFIAQALSFGSRKQFLKKLHDIMRFSDGNPLHWVVEGQYTQNIPDAEGSYYRMITNQQMLAFLNALRPLYQNEKGLRQLFSQNSNLHSPNFCADEASSPIARASEQNNYPLSILHSPFSASAALASITDYFARNGSTGVIPKNTQSSCKRLCMFLRWMVRIGSPVDIGLWSDIIDRRTLIMPLDTHVVQEARRLGIIDIKTPSMAAALKLTEKMSEIFPDDPLKGDFALFGVGVDTEN